MRVRGPALLSFFVMTLWSAVASAEVVVIAEEVLPLSGQPIELAAIAESSGEPLQVVVEGTISSSIDGSEVDALHRRTTLRDESGSLIWEVDGPFVRFPAATRLVDAEPDVHRYVFEIPRAPSMPVGVDLGPLAMRNLVTRSDMALNSQGAFRVTVLGRPNVVAGVAGEEQSTSSVVAMSRLWANIPLVGGGLIALTALIAGVFGYRRRRRAPEVLLIGRAQTASQVVIEEGRALGPAFAHVVGAAGELFQSVRSGRGRLRAIRHARRRLRRLNADGARARRQALELREERTLGELQQLTERLEETAAQLAACRVEQRCAVDIEALSRLLGDELEVALTATAEAQGSGATAS